MSDQYNDIIIQSLAAHEFLYTGKANLKLSNMEDWFALHVGAFSNFYAYLATITFDQRQPCLTKR